MADTTYARNGSVHLAYRQTGESALDLLLLPGALISIDSFDDHPLARRFVDRFTSFARTIIHDRRGVGQSDGLEGAPFPQPEEAASDLVAILDHAGVEKVAVVASYEAATTGIALAATHPDRVLSLVVINGFSRFLRADDHPWGYARGAPESYKRIVEGENQPDEDILTLVAPSVADDQRFRDWWDRSGRRAASPSAALRFGELLFTVDVRDLLSRIAAPTLIVHKIGCRVVNIEEGRFLASKIPGAKIVEVPGEDGMPFVDADEILDVTQEFLTGAKSTRADRVLATVLFTDIVDSTRLATELGDRRWRDLLDAHDRTVEREIQRGGGRLVKQTGDGSLATFAGPGPAIRCVMAMRDSLAADGIRIRAGIHTGEVEVRGDDVGGIAVHIAARVMGEAGPDEIIVSSVVPPLVVGSEIEFTDMGPRELKGVPGEWRVLSVDG